MRLLKFLLGGLFLAISLNVAVSQEIKVLEVVPYLENLQSSSDSNVQFIDVRTPAEYAQGTILDAVNMDVLDESFVSSVAKLDPSKPVYLFCRSGNRSQKAAGIMIEMGFTEIYDLQDGYQAWQLFNASDHAKDQSGD